MSKRAPKQDTTGKPWARYLRLSKAEAAEDRGKTKDERMALTIAKLDAHDAELKHWLDSKELPYSDALVFSDPGLSAWKPNVKRPGWDQMMAMAEAGDLAGIAIVAIDRFTRDVTTMEDLIRLAATTSVNIGGPRAGNLDLTTYEGIQQARGAAMQAANESLATSFRIKETLARKMAAGQPMGAGRAFGFELGGVEQRPDEVAVVREMAQRLLAGETLQKLAAELNSRGLTTSLGGQWTGGNLGRLLGAARYGGHVVHHGEKVGTIKGEPVLDADTYDDVQALLASRRRGRRPTGQFLLTGLLTCSTCKRTMNGAHKYKPLADGTRQREYRCPIQQGGCGRLILAEPVERIVGAHMIKLRSKPVNRAALAAEDQSLNDARASAEEKLAATQQRRDELEEKYNAFEVSEETYKKSRATLNARIAKLSDERKELALQTTGRTTDPGSLWDAMNDEEKREAIRRYRVRIVILPKQPGTRRFDPNRVTFPA